MRKDYGNYAILLLSEKEENMTKNEKNLRKMRKNYGNYAILLIRE